MLNSPSELSERETRIRSDKETINLLAKHNADFSKEHMIDFFFVGNKDGLNNLEKVLAEQGYEKNIEKSSDNELLVYMHIKLELMRSHLITESLDSLAKEYDVSFDGWGTVAKR